MPLALEMVRQLRLEVEQDLNVMQDENIEEDSLNERVSDQEQMLFGEPIKAPVAPKQVSGRSSATKSAKNPSR